MVWFVHTGTVAMKASDLNISSDCPRDRVLAATRALHDLHAARKTRQNRAGATQQRSDVST